MGSYGSPNLKNRNDKSSNQFKMIKCRKCGEVYHWQIKRCPKCGASQKPFYKKGLFWLAVVIILACALAYFYSGSVKSFVQSVSNKFGLDKVFSSNQANVMFDNIQRNSGDCEIEYIENGIINYYDDTYCVIGLDSRNLRFDINSITFTQADLNTTLATVNVTISNYLKNNYQIKKSNIEIYIGDTYIEQTKKDGTIYNIEKAGNTELNISFVMPKDACTLELMYREAEEKQPVLLATFVISEEKNQ